MRGNAAPATTAAHIAHIATWAARAQPLAPRYAPLDLERKLGRRMRAIAHALELLGWQRRHYWARRRGRRVRCTTWIPPRGRPPNFRPGRPRFDLIDTLNMEIQ
jgi:hypothetical protein